ncbi:MAG: homocysteine S-methyltransferase family protein [Anaerolineales bacterium]|nr:homocysteine S-methyltransferase family protein [Anaerolineales bacterium]
MTDGSQIGDTPDIREKGLLERLAGGETFLADGAMGTLLMAQGLEPGAPPEEWNVAYPQRIADVHRAYIAAGSRIILSNTFGGSRIKLKRAGMDARTAEFNRAGAELAREAAGGRAFVAGDIGPCGEMMEPMGGLTFAGAVDAFAEQARALAESGVDLLWVETMMDLEEARAAVTGARRASDLPVFCSMTFGPGGRTIMGIGVRQALESLRPLGLAAFGANCGEGLDVMDEVLDQLRDAAPALPWIAKPNAGLPRMIGDKAVYDVGPQLFAERTAALIARGVQVAGGCCGSSPEFIAAIARRISK